MKTYTIKNNRIMRSYLDGFEADKTDGVKGVSGAIDHLFLLPPIDGVEEDVKWGRVTFDINLPANSFYKVYAFSSNTKDNYIAPEWGYIQDLVRRKENFEQRRAFFEREEWTYFVGMNDLLLYNLKGRYLWLAIEAVGDGEVTINNMVVNIPEDDFLEFFPQIYQEWDGFLHKYLSIYSSIYNDFQTKCEKTGELFDPDTAPKQLLPVFASWMGIDIDGNIMEEDVMRKLVKEAYQLNKMKGTRWSIERLSNILLDTTPTIVENNLIREKDDMSERYGLTRYDLTVIINKAITENQKISFSNILKQFVPIRCKLHIYFLNEQSTLDDYTYLDMNAQVYAKQEMSLDNEYGLDQGVVLAQ